MDHQDMQIPPLPHEPNGPDDLDRSGRGLLLSAFPYQPAARGGAARLPARRSQRLPGLRRGERLRQRGQESAAAGDDG